MEVKIQAVLSSRRLCLNYFEGKNSENFFDNLHKWESFRRESVVTIVANKSAIVHVYTSDGEFNFPKINANMSTQKQGGDTYFIAASDSWSKSDIENITSLTEFELSALFIQLVHRIVENQIDPVALFESANKIVMGEENDEEEVNFQYVGCIGDGQQIVWQNPNWTIAESLLPQLRAVCSQLGIEWQVEDKR